MVPRQTKALELGCTVMEQGGNSVSALVSTPQYSRLRYTPLRHVQLRILIGTMRIGISTFYQIVKLQLKHLVNTRSLQNWFGTATNPSYNWLNITEFSRYGCQVMRVVMAMKRQISWLEQDLKIRSQDLNLLAASQLELPRKRPGTGQIGNIKNIWNPLLDSNRQRDSYQDPLSDVRRICWN
jgi:hypothetical protein